MPNRNGSRDVYASKSTNANLHQPFSFYYHHRASQNIADMTFLVGHNGVGGGRM